MTNIILPDTFTASVVSEGGDGTWLDHQRHFIVLQFGYYEIARWEWQPDRPLEQRREPDSDDIAEFVAGKMIEFFAGRL